MIADTELHPFVRFYKYFKKEESAFSSKYLLSSNVVLISHGERRRQSLLGHEQKAEQALSPSKTIKIEQKPEKKQQKQSDKQQKQQVQEQQQDSSSSAEEESLSQQEIKPQKKIKKNFKEQRRKLEMTLQQLQEYKAYTKVNMKGIKIVEKDQRKGDREFQREEKQFKKKKKYVKAEEKRERKNKEKEERKKMHRKDYEDNKKQIQVEYDQYLSLQEIEKSRVQEEQKYFKGRVEYGEGPKWRGRIASEQIEGIFIIEGKHRNRSLHDDKVYFQVIHKQADKSYCNVVHILKDKRFIVGKIDFISGKNQYILNPVNGRITGLNVEEESICKTMKAKMNTHYFKAEYIGWNSKSQFPQCRIVEEFGKFGDIQIETSALLKTNNVDDVEHDPEIVRKDLQKFLTRMNENGQYEIAQQQIARREDLRKKRIFTIDPLNARDFDDALSIEQSGEDFELGVHIADASFFCEEGSLIDRQARKRTTSVYLVHRVIPMLPRLLCQNFCSLNPGCQRLTFSLWVKVNKVGEVLAPPRITRSIIKSCARFTYEQAQTIIEGSVKSQDDIQQGFGCVNKDDFEKVAQDIKIMHGLASQLRKRRVQRGSLFFQIPRKVFQLDESKQPKDFKIYERKQANFLVEQFMILANQLIGDILVQETKEHALLRRHRYPGSKKIARFQQFMKNIGLPLTFTPKTRVQDTINQVLEKQGLKQTIKDLVKYETIGLLQAADYFIVGKSPSNTWVHYALNAPVYTHFTSPIRRYPDILVHRQLAAIIQKKEDKAKIPKQLIQQCNEKKLMAKRVSNGCEKIFMCLYLKENHALVSGIICEAEDWGIKVCVPSFDFKGTVRFREVQGLSVASVEQDTEDKKTLKMSYKGKTPVKFSLNLYDSIDLRLDCKDSFPLDYRLSIVLPNPQIPGQHIIIG